MTKCLIIFWINKILHYQRLIQAQLNSKSYRNSHVPQVEHNFVLNSKPRCITIQLHITTYFPGCYTSKSSSNRFARLDHNKPLPLLILLSILLVELFIKSVIRLPTEMYRVDHRHSLYICLFITVQCYLYQACLTISVKPAGVVHYVTRVAQIDILYSVALLVISAKLID